MDLFGCQTAEISCPSPKDLLSNTIASNKLLRDAHGVAVEQLAEERAKRSAIGKRQQAGFEFLDETIRVGFLLWRPLSSTQGRSLLLLLAGHADAIGLGRRLGRLDQERGHLSTRTSVNLHCTAPPASQLLRASSRGPSQSWTPLRGSRQQHKPSTAYLEA